jgi:undecaprenyl pyrophosphate synthase
MHPPRHFALIPDGVRRWSVRHSVSLEIAYEAVVGALTQLSDTVFAHEIGTLSVYVLSKHNLLRTSDELAATIRSHIRIFQGVLPLLAKKWEATIYHIGDVNSLPGEYGLALRNACEESHSPSSKRKIYIYAGYGAEWELDARLRGDANGFHCSLPDDVDLLLRTGGELRLSGFLPIQLRYAELFFLEKLFPDTQSVDVERVIQAYGERERRFGR